MYAAVKTIQEAVQELQEQMEGVRAKLKSPGAELPRQGTVEMAGLVPDITAPTLTARVEALEQAVIALEQVLDSVGVAVDAESTISQALAGRVGVLEGVAGRFVALESQVNEKVREPATATPAARKARGRPRRNA